MSKLRLAYFGTPTFSASFLEKILLSPDLPVEIALVVTRPDKKVGRKQIITPSPVKTTALTHHIQVWDKPLKELTPLLHTLQIDLAFLFAYGRILPDEIIKAPRYGFWNLHPSLLPLYRGASPIAFPLMLGESKTGVSLMVMNEEMDHGPILAQQEYDIKMGERRDILETNLTNQGFTMFQNAIFDLVGKKGDGGVQSPTSPPLEPTTPLPVSQNHDLATYTKIITRDDGYISPKILQKGLSGGKLIPAELPKILLWYYEKNALPTPPHSSAGRVVVNLHLGLSPWPGIWTTIVVDRQERRLKILDCSLEKNQLVLHTVQLDGKNLVSYTQFKEHYSL